MIGVDKSICKSWMNLVPDEPQVQTVDIKKNNSQGDKRELSLTRNTYSNLQPFMVVTGYWFIPLNFIKVNRI